MAWSDTRSPVLDYAEANPVPAYSPPAAILFNDVVGTEDGYEVGTEDGKDIAIEG